MPSPQERRRVCGFGLWSLALALLLAQGARAADIYVRAKVVEPAGDKFKITTGGWRHDGAKDQWYLPATSVEATGGQWSPWIDLTSWELPKRSNRQGGLAEWPALHLSITRLGAAGGGGGGKHSADGCTLQVQLADKPDERSVVISFTEKSESSSIGFLLPHPLREKKGDFETGTQMVARQLAWAKEAAGQSPIKLKHFVLATGIWGGYDPALSRQSAQTLTTLGINTINGVPASILRQAGVRTYAHTHNYTSDPDATLAIWTQQILNRARKQVTDDDLWTEANIDHYVISDEVSVLPFQNVNGEKVNGWFRDYLKSKNVTAADLGKPLEQVVYPMDLLKRKALPRFEEELAPAEKSEKPGVAATVKAALAPAPAWTQQPPPPLADLSTRKLYYHAAKFGQWWSAKQLRYTSDLIRGAQLGMKTETLPTDHGFFNAWGPPMMGMGFRLLDLFELGHQESVDLLAAEDWMGLNHMYGPNYTWTGAQTFEYLSAIMRSGMTGPRMSLMSLLTPSDEGYLRLKAYSQLSQGSKTFFYWTFGPTYIGTENYWSDLRSQYDGMVKFHRALQQAEEVVYPAQPVRDPVAVLYSVSHDLWHTDDPAGFVENRLTWHALRHLHIQPDILREEDVETGRLRQYKALYITGQCLTRRAAAAIDGWVKAGGVVYLSAGAATRDEFYEPFLPPFAAAVWPADAAARMVKEKHTYNERRDLPSIAPLTTATVTLGENQFPINVIGCRLAIKENAKPAREEALAAAFADGPRAGVTVEHGKGKVVAVGFLPGLAYSPFKAGQTTLDEVWPAGPRNLLALPLKLAGVTPIADASEPVVEASLLSGPEGSALVLVNYTYKPIPHLKIDLSLEGPVARALSTEGAAVSMSKTERGIALELPLEWADIVVLPNK